MTGGLNPFPGPQPYRASDRDRFFGRDAAILALGDSILSHRVLTVYGPSGAGKSSLLQAGIIPMLDEEWDLRPVKLESWPPLEILELGPASHLVAEIAEQLQLGHPEDLDLDGCLDLAFRRSDRPILLVLDQLEQLLVNHGQALLQEFVSSLTRLDTFPGGGLHVVLSLREDYLGRWNDLLHRRPRLTRHGFRLSRLTLPEITAAIERTVASGVPPQHWPRDDILSLVEQMAIPGQWYSDAPEVESAYVQIVCHAIWQAGGLHHVANRSPDHILRGYLEKMLKGLGPLQSSARELLEQRFITRSGSRVPVTRQAALEQVGTAEDTDHILHVLERARILRAQEHHGDRFFELGHDWLALPIRESAERRRAAEHERYVHRRRTILAVVGVALLGFVVVLLLLNAQTEKQRRNAEQQLHQAITEKAQTRMATRQAEREKLGSDFATRQATHALQQAQRSRDEAKQAKTRAMEAERIALANAETALANAETARIQEAKAIENAELARDTARIFAARQLQEDPTRALPFLRDVRHPAEHPHHSEWMKFSYDMLQQPISRWESSLPPDYPPVALIRQDRFTDPITIVLSDGRVLQWRPEEGTDPILVLQPGSIGKPFFSPDHRWMAGIDTAHRLRVWSLVDLQLQLEATPDGQVMLCLAVSTDQHLVAVGWKNQHVQLLDGAQTIRILQHQDPVWSVAFHPDGQHLLSVSGTNIFIWDLQQENEPQRMLWANTHEQAFSATFHPTDPDQVLATIGRRALLWHVSSREVEPLGCTMDAYLRPEEWPFARLVLISPSYSNVVFTLNQDHWAQIQSLQQPLSCARVESVILPVAFSFTEGHLLLSRPNTAPSLLTFEPTGNILFFQSLQGQTGRTQAFTFNTGGEQIITAAEDGTLRVWPLPTAKLSHIIESHLPGYSAHALAFSEAGDELFVEDSSNTIHCWRLDGRPCTSSPPSATARWSSDPHATSPDGAWRASSTSEATILLRPTADPNTRITFAEHTAYIHIIAFDPSGTRLASASQDGSVRLWPVMDTPAVQQALRAASRRCTSPEYRHRYLGEDAQQALEAYRACLRTQGGTR